MGDKDVPLVRLRGSSTRDVRSMAIAIGLILLGIVVGFFIADGAGVTFGFPLGSLLAIVAFFLVKQRADKNVKKETLSARRYRAIRWWYQCWTLAFLCWVVAVFLLFALVDKMAIWHLALLFLPTFVYLGVAEIFVRLLRGWCCPKCLKPWRQRGLLASYPHVCRQCGFSIDGKV